MGKKERIKEIDNRVDLGPFLGPELINNWAAIFIIRCADLFN